MKLVKIKNRYYPANEFVGVYSKLLDEQYLSDFEYIPYLDALWNEKDKIIIYSLNKMYQIKNEKYYEYFQNIRLKYAQIQNLSEIDYPGIWGFNVAVPIEYLGSDTNFSIEEYILNKNAFLLEIFDEDVTKYKYLLNEVVEYDWTIRHTSFTNPINPSCLVQEDIDFLQFAKIGLDKKLKVIYTNLTSGEVSHNSSKNSTLEVKSLEIKALVSLCKADFPNLNIKALTTAEISSQFPNLKPTRLGDKFKAPNGGVVLFDYVELHQYSCCIPSMEMEEHNFESFRKNILPQLVNCDIIITNKRKLKRNDRFIGLVKQK